MTALSFPHDGQCHHWSSMLDRRCSRQATVVIELATETRVTGLAMFGNYDAGEWQFCAQHANLFEAGRQ